MTTRGGSIAEALCTRAVTIPDRLAIALEQDGAWETWSWRRFWEHSSISADGLRRAGIAPGDRVLMLLPEVRDAVPAIFGAWLLGAVPVQIGVPYRLSDVTTFIEQLGTTARTLRATTLLTSPRFAHLAPRGDTIRVIPVVAEVSGTGNAVGPPAVPGSAPALIQLTSGSTGHPRAVVVSHRRLMLHMAAMSEALPSHERSVAVSWLPLHHDMGLIGGLLFPYFNGFPAHMISTETFRSRPFCWLETMSRVRGTICAASPSAYGICLRLAERARSAGLDLSAWECAMVGAEPVSLTLLRGFIDAFGPAGFSPNTFFPVYGLAEATVAVTFPALGAPLRFDCVEAARLERDGCAVPARPGAGALEFTGVGRPIPGTTIRIVDADRRTLPERRVGEIEVRSDSLMEGYFGDPEATKATVVDGWLATGDIGYVADGVLFVTGRKKDIIIKGGHNVLPTAVEEPVSADPDVRSGCVAAVGVWSHELQTERVYVVCETRLDPERYSELSERLRERLRTCGIVVDRIVPVSPGVLPRTTSGKIRRRAVRDALARVDVTAEEALLAIDSSFPSPSRMVAG
jgi:acyl-CoA synthetase (AMP-forming)/AMP-acid ligase II